MTLSWRLKKIYMAHALVQTIIFKICGRSRPHLLYFSKYKRRKIGQNRQKNYHYLSMYVCIYVSGTKPQGLFKTDPPICPSQLKFFFKHFFAKNWFITRFRCFWVDLSKKIFLNFLVKYSTSAHYGGHTIYSFPKSVDVLHYWVQMNILTKYGDQWMTGVPVIMLQRWHIS